MPPPFLLQSSGDKSLKNEFYFASIFFYEASLKFQLRYSNLTVTIEAPFSRIDRL